jgi:hypothetical protein
VRLGMIVAVAVGAGAPEPAPGDALSIVATGTGAAGGAIPSSWYTSCATYCEASKPHLAQTKRIGDFTISGVTANSYLVPQLHWIFKGFWGSAELQIG